MRLPKRKPRSATSLAADELGGPQCKLGAIFDPELVENGVEVDLHSTLGDAELGCDVAVAKTLADELDQLALAAGQWRCKGRALLRLARALGYFRVDPAI